MASIFSQDNPFNDFMSTVGDMAMISIARTICSIPVVTVGASTAAACEVARELQKRLLQGHLPQLLGGFQAPLPDHACPDGGNRRVLRIGACLTRGTVGDELTTP